MKTKTTSSIEKRLNVLEGREAVRFCEEEDRKEEKQEQEKLRYYRELENKLPCWAFVTIFFLCVTVLCLLVSLCVYIGGC